MKRRYGLESIIGKKSKLRFPRHVFIPKVDLLRFTLPANSAVAEPPLSTAITMKKGDPYDFCDLFNEETYEFEDGTPVNCVYLISIAVSLLEIRTPPVFSLFGIVHDLDEIEDVEKFRGKSSDILLTFSNLGLIKLDSDKSYFFSDYLSIFRTIYSSMLSYNCRRKCFRVPKSLIPKSRLRKYLLSRGSYTVTQNRHLRRLKHLIFKIAKRDFKRRRSHTLKLLDVSLEHMDFWEIYEDHEWEEIMSQNYTDTFDYIQTSETFLDQDKELNHNSLCISNWSTPSLVDNDLMIPILSKEADEASKDNLLFIDTEQESEQEFNQYSDHDPDFLSNFISYYFDYLEEYEEENLEEQDN
jgi:hypothetical protein